jgi:hypothetical protein
MDEGKIRAQGPCFAIAATPLGHHTSFGFAGGDVHSMQPGVGSFGAKRQIQDLVMGLVLLGLILATA